MKARNGLLWVGVILIMVTGVVHAIHAPESFEEAVYKGWLFFANIFGSLIAAYGIFRNRPWGWKLGFLISFASLILYIASRTIGLTFLPAEPEAWFEPLGVISLFSEGLFVVVYVLVIRNSNLLRRK